VLQSVVKAHCNARKEKTRMKVLSGQKDRGKRYLMGEYLKVVRDEFSTISYVVLLH